MLIVSASVSSWRLRRISLAMCTLFRDLRPVDAPLVDDGRCQSPMLADGNGEMLAAYERNNTRIEATP